MRAMARGDTESTQPQPQPQPARQPGQPVPPGHDPSGPGESENAPGHNKPEAEPREDMNDAAREEIKRREDAAKSGQQTDTQ